MSVYEELIKRFPKSPEQALWQFRIGQIAEAAGNDKLALDAYGRAANTSGSPEHVEGSIQDLALRCANYLRSPGNPQAHARDLATALATALRGKDIDELRRLASRTHFTLGGAGSERQFVDADKVLSALSTDLRASKVRVDPTALRGSVDKLYLMTSGWAGRLCAGVVLFVLVRRRAGWEWGGIAVTQLGAGFDDVLPPPEREENQSLRIRIKAPWPSGLCFRAGGVVQFGFIAAGGPPAWWIASLADDCGFGVWGFYYNQSGHSGNQAFAIDFTRNVRGVPWADSSGGNPALSVFAGLVNTTQCSFASGDPNIGNETSWRSTTRTRSRSCSP